MARLSQSTTRLLVPLSRDFSIALLNSVRFHLKLYGMARPAASYGVEALGKVMEKICSRNGAKGNAHVMIRASGSNLAMTLRLPTGLIAAARLKALLPPPPRGVRIALKTGRGGLVLTFEASIPGRD